jgi:membrane-bound lytic murein transglycosylase B
MSTRRALPVLLLAALAATARAEDVAPENYAQREDVAAFIHQLVQRHAFNAEELRTVFARARREDAVLAAMRAQPKQSDSWDAYRALFVNERHLRNGLDFWVEHRRPLRRARRTYGVPEEIVVAILGVETFYGRNTGRWRVIDALATLAFDYPPRALFFRGELENYLLFARELELDVFSVKGSYAGAIGMPQFMPGSYLRYAVDFDGDGAIDLLDNAADAIGSVANFLRRHGWRPGEPVQRAARISGEAFRGVVAADALPRNTVDELRKLGVEPKGAPLPGDTPAVLLRLETPQKPDEYRIGLQNLYVLTRYNQSLFYALSVADLAGQLRAARAKAGGARAR